MNKIHFIKNQKLPTKTIKHFIEYKGWKRTKIIDLNNIELYFSPTTYKKNCIVLLEVNNEYWYSETFDKFIKDIGKTKAETILDFTTIEYLNKLERVITTTTNFSCIISDWGKIKIIEDESTQNRNPSLES